MAKSKQISILVDEDILADIDAQVGRLGRSRNWVINRRLEQYVAPEMWEVSRVGGMGFGKKIAEISAGAVGAESGGTPDLPRLGKAQIEEEMLCEAFIPHGPHLLTGRDGDTAFCNPQSCKWCAEGKSSNRVDEPFLYGRSGVAPDFNEVCVPKRQLPDGVPCGHAGCLSHVSHPCDGCGRIGGRRPIYNMEDNEAAQKNRGGSVPLDMRFSEKWLREMSAFETGGLMACSPEILGHMLEEAKTNAGVAATLHKAGVELDREILVRWGLAENYKPKTSSRPLVDKNKSEDEVGGGKDVEGSKGGEGGASAGKNRRVAKGLPKNDDVGKSAAVGVGKSEVGNDEKEITTSLPELRKANEDEYLGTSVLHPLHEKVDMAALRDICAGKTIQQVFADIQRRDEVDLCGFKSYNEIDGDNYVCGKEVHDSKVKHGDWIKV